MTIAAYPLQWPEGWPRTENLNLKDGRFGVRRANAGSSWASLKDITITEAVSRVQSELQKMGIDHQDVVISTNVRTRLDGLPRSGEREPDDGGAAVYWETRKGERRVMAIDQYHKVADNLAAIAATLDAMRAIERHGGAQILDRAFTGFIALPAPNGKRDWWDVLGVSQNASPEQIKAAYRKKSSENHPDKLGGSETAMTEINLAYREATR